MIDEIRREDVDSCLYGESYVGWALKYEASSRESMSQSGRREVRVLNEGIGVGEG